MAIQLLKYTTSTGSKMSLKNSDNLLGIELLFISCASDEREKIVHDLAAKHDEMRLKANASPTG